MDDLPSDALTDPTTMARLGSVAFSAEGLSDAQRERLRNSIQALKEIEQQVMWLRRFGLGDGRARTVEQAKEFEVTIERIRQLESTLAELRRSGGGGADTAGVREPRRPLPTAGAGKVQIDLDPDI